MLSRFTPCRPCCVDRECTVYLPCCIRDLRISHFVDVSGTGGGTYAYTKRFTLTNLCNDQESMDWSSWEEVGTASGGETIRHAGRIGQGCTFGIDIDHEHLFCPCASGNFTARLELCNPHDSPITVTVSLPTMSVGFANALQVTPCPLELLTDLTFDSVILQPGESKTFVSTWGPVNWKGCISNCVKDRSDIIVEDDLYLDDFFDTTCLIPIACADQDTSLSLGSEINPGVSLCTDSPCPPCGCVLDHDQDTQTAPTFVSFTSGSGTGSVTLSQPSGAQDDDIFLLTINGEGEDTNADDPPPGDWNPISTPPSVASGTDGNADRTRLSVYWHRFDSANPPSYVVPDAGNYTLAALTCWRGCKFVLSPVDSQDDSNDTTNDTSVSVGGLTTTRNDCTLVAITTAGDNVTTSSWVNSSLSGVTQRVNVATASGSGGHIGIASGEKTNAGTVTATTATVSDSEQEANWAIALAPKEKTFSVDAGSCACGCGASEARRACKEPKETLLGMDADQGEFGLCEDYNGGQRATKYVVIFINAQCQFTGGIFRNGDLWEYERVGIYDPPGGVGPIRQIRGVSETGNDHCTVYNIEWSNNTLLSQLEITVDGITSTDTYQYWTAVQAGQAYIVAQTGSTFTSQL